ncbi:MAG: polysaccharide ABC transporter ATP-binding protein [Chitinophagaceae bacterium]
MSEVVIKVEDVSKQYRLGSVGTGTLSHDLNRMWARVRGKEDPFAKLGETNDRTTKATSDFVWSLKDINFEVKHGEVMGIIGRNGAGKSTLLKILSRTTSPTTGNIKIKGRVASLLEVGTGFHPELTGKENIYLNGAILGMTKAEISRKFDEIVDFSGVERYIDTPVKRYSSGMYVRLAFAVAANLEPDILIVDEVLAVGDAEFQKKCLGKMKDVSVNDGRTVLFVSHNLLAVKSLCKTGLWLDKGLCKGIGPIDKIIDSYMQKNQSNKSSAITIDKEKDGFTVLSVDISNNGAEGCFNIEEDLTITVNVKSEKHYEAININLFFNSLDGSVIFATVSPAEKFENGTYTYTCVVPAYTLNDILYSLDLMVVQNGPKIIHHFKDFLSMEGIEDRREGAWLDKFPGLIRPQYFKWSKTKI